MNRFLTRKKDKKSKAKPEPEPQINIAAALPTNDDFRTSLIMPGLSTRFSMLREQDDPNSKIGKASDDSVLQPKRQSRLHEYGFVPGGLSDIAEVSSLHSRPGFNAERQNSFDSHATEQTEGGSIMSRTRPGEGNVLFGGRQKVYKLSGTGTGQGRAVYDDDVHLSYFQKMKIQEKERQAAADALEHNSTAANGPSSPGKDTFSPASDTFSQRRETSSSTNSGSNARSSTAATSIASQTTTTVHPAPASPTELTRSGTKGRRLYDQGLDQQMYEQQSSAINRLNSIQRARGPNGRATPPLLYTQTRSATSLNERFNRGPAMRTESPTASLGASRDVHSNSTSPTLSRPSSPPPMSPLSPLSPMIPETEEAKTLNTALQHQDRGKATAMGAFNKPKQAFSEEAYAERTRRMQQERDASVPKSVQPRKLTLRERAEMEKRKRAGSGATASHSPSEQKQAPNPFSMFQSAASHIKSTTTADTLQVSPRPSPSPSTVQSPDSQASQTFFASTGSSEDEADAPQPLVAKPAERGRQNLPTATGPAPSILEHPALRSRSNSRPAEPFTHPALRDRSNSRPSPPESRTSPNIEPTEPKNYDVQSPTLGGTTGGLNVLVRQHLRNVSNVSSVYDDDKSIMSPPPIQTQHVGLQRRQPASDNDSLTYSGHSHSNPWDLDDIESNPFHADRGSVSSVSPTTDMPKPRALAMSPTESTFGKDAEIMHRRDGSTDEHEAMQRDLAQRQRAIQQSLRAKAEGRSTSPAPQAPSGGLKNALNMLRAKSSRESFATVDSNIKKFGLGVNSNGNSSTSLVGDWKNDGPSSRRPLRLRQQSDTRRDDDGRKGKSPPTSSTNSMRERSSSELSSGRSGSRPPYRDDLGQAMAEGHGARASAYPANEGPSVSGYAANATPPLPAEGKSRSRSNSRTTAANYFESKHLQPIKTGNGQNGTFPRLSPGLPASPRPSPGNPSPNMNVFRPQQSPIPAFSGNNTPPVSNPGTPVKAAFNPKAVPPPMTKGNLRKKSIAKSEIGDPIFLSTTSVIDTVSLADASVRMSELQQAEAAAAAAQAPPVPPINPRRRFGTGKSEYRDPAIQYGIDAPNVPFMNQTRSASSDAMSSQTTLPRPELRSAASEGKNLRGLARRQTETGTTATPGQGRVSPPMPAKMDGGMF